MSRLNHGLPISFSHDYRALGYDVYERGNGRSLGWVVRLQGGWWWSGASMKMFWRIRIGDRVWKTRADAARSLWRRWND